MNRFRSAFAYRLIALASVATVSPARPAGAQIRFEDVTSDAGIDFIHVNGASEEKYMVETMGSGGGFFDYDSDGDLDVYLVNGTQVPMSSASTATNKLYRNDGAGRFQDVTLEAGVGDRGYGMGMTAGDIDNDGDDDLYVTNFGDNVLYRNNGDGTFDDITASAGVAAGGWSSSASFGDYDRDGVLDLYVGRYVDFDFDNHKFCGNQAKRIKAYCHPDVYDPVPSLLYRGRGDGTFEDVTREAGLFIEDEGKTLGVVWGDVDNDGEPDLYVANDSMRNFLYRNRGDGTFEDVTLLAGVGYSEDGQPQAGMGTDMADFDDDGYQDLTVTNLDFENNAIYRGGAGGIFSDDSYRAGVAETTLNFVGFGTFFFDFDNDGRMDLFVANGHIIDNIHLFGSVSTYEERNFLFRNQGEGVLLEVGAALGDALVRRNVARGAAPGDIDGDGDLDVLVTRCGQSVLLLRNAGAEAVSSMTLHLVGKDSNRSAVGARAWLWFSSSEEKKQLREVKSARSYLSQGALDLHFGLGELSQKAPRAIVVRWPSGLDEQFPFEGAGRFLAVEGEGSLRRRP